MIAIHHLGTMVSSWSWMSLLTFNKCHAISSFCIIKCTLHSLYSKKVSQYIQTEHGTQQQSNTALIINCEVYLSRIKINCALNHITHIIT